MNIDLRFNSNALVAVAVLSTACGGASDGPEAENAQERQRLLRSVTDRVILPGYAELAATTDSLATAAGSWSAAAARGEDTSAARATVRDAFMSAYRAMQYAEVLQVGPYGPASKFDGGENIRDEVYSWPVVNPCRVDQEIVRQGYAEARFVEQSLVNVYGFDALEYLVYRDDPDNSCPEPVSINAQGTWDALDGAELEARRAAYAAVVARAIADNAATLANRWEGGFADELRSAGSSGSIYRTSQSGLDALFASMFYIEKQVKDQKLALPLGLSPDCAEATCPDLLESQHALASRVALEVNLTAFSDLYHGGPAGDSERYGFDAFLREIGATQLSDDLASATEAALARAPEVPEPMRDALGTDSPTALHSAVRDLTTLLKSQFVSVLNLRVPSEGAADND